MASVEMRHAVLAAVDEDDDAVERGDAGHRPERIHGVRQPQFHGPTTAPNVDDERDVGGSLARRPTSAGVVVRTPGRDAGDPEQSSASAADVDARSWCNVSDPLHDYVGVRAEAEEDLAESLEALYSERYVGLARLGHLLTGSRGDGEDLAQTAFAALAQSWGDVRSPRAYLRRTVVNRAADLHRRAHRQVPARPEVVVGEPVVDETWDAVQQLSGIQRTVVVLRFYEDLPLVDIADLLARPESTVRSDLRRALLHLRKELER